MRMLCCFHLFLFFSPPPLLSLLWSRAPFTPHLLSSNQGAPVSVSCLSSPIQLPFLSYPLPLPLPSLSLLSKPFPHPSSPKPGCVSVFCVRPIKLPCIAACSYWRTFSSTIFHQRIKEIIDWKCIHKKKDCFGSMFIKGMMSSSVTLVILVKSFKM